MEIVRILGDVLGQTKFALYFMTVVLVNQFNAFKYVMSEFVNTCDWRCQGGGVQVGFVGTGIVITDTQVRACNGVFPLVAKHQTRSRVKMRFLQFLKVQLFLFHYLLTESKNIFLL